MNAREEHDPTPRPARKEFKMNDEQVQEIKRASRPVMYIVVNGQPPKSPQENANAAWERLGAELGFKPYTVQPVPGKGVEFFTAEVMGEQE